MPAADPEKRVVVTVDQDADSFEDVVEALRKVGLEVRERLDLLGIVVGSVAGDRVDELRRLHGIKAIEEEAEMEIPEPDEEIQ